MTAPITTGPGEHLQRIRRGWTDEFTDQHGRKFAATYDLANSRPIGEFQPVGFSPPWLPQMSAIEWERPGGFRFRWKYEDLANEFSQGSEAFYTEVMEFMIEHMPTIEPPDVDEPIPAKARRLFKPPLSAAVPLAAEAGDPWILGVPGAPVNFQLKELLAQSVNANGREAVAMIRERTKARLHGVEVVPTRPSEAEQHTAPKTINTIDLATIKAVTYQEFVGGAMKAGMSMADAAIAWKAHRENVALEQSA